MTASRAKGDTAKPASISAQRRKMTLTRALKLIERLLEEYRPAFELYVRAYREYHGFDPDTEEVSHEWGDLATYDD